MKDMTKRIALFLTFAVVLVSVTYFVASPTSEKSHERRELISLNSLRSDNTIQPGLRFERVNAASTSTDASTPTPTPTDSATPTPTPTDSATPTPTPTDATTSSSTQTAPSTSDASTQTTDQTPFFWTCPGVNDGKNFDRIRKDYNDLTEAERQLYIKALQKAYDDGHYHLFVNIHATMRNERYAHNLASFFAWHRKYLLEFENMLRSLGTEFQCVTIPFWDWAQEARVCGKIRGNKETKSDEVHGSNENTCESFASVSHIMKDFGGGGEPGTITRADCSDEFQRTANCDPRYVGCVTSGPFAAWKDLYGRKCVLRYTEDQFTHEGMMAGKVYYLSLSLSVYLYIYSSLKM